MLPYFLVCLQIILLLVDLVLLRSLLGISLGQRVALTLLAVFGPGSIVVLILVYMHKRGRLDLRKTPDWFGSGNS